MSDEAPERPKARLTILPLDDLGLAELDDYIAELRREIARAEQVASRKQAHRGAADLIFGRRPGSTPE